MLRSAKASRAPTVLAAFLVLEAVLGSSLALAQQNRTPAPAPAPAPAQTGQTNPASQRACRVKEHAGGTTCTANVPEGVCAAIAREAKGTYTWTDGDCP